MGMRSVETGHMVQQDEASTGRHSGFIGSMQSFIFNGNHYFQVGSLTIHSLFNQSKWKDSLTYSEAIQILMNLIKQHRPTFIT